VLEGCVERADDTAPQPTMRLVIPLPLAPSHVRNTAHLYYSNPRTDDVWKKNQKKKSQVGSDEGGGNTLKVLDPASVLHVSAYYYICVLILFLMRLHYFMCPHTTISVSRRHITPYASSYYYICVLILLHVSSY
jgi:hypothetical protein